VPEIRVRGVGPSPYFTGKTPFLAGLPVPKPERVQNLLKLEDFILQLQLVRAKITVNFAK